MTVYGIEAVDRLPFSTDEKAQRYRTADYGGAVGLNWYRTDPTPQSAIAYYLQPDELAVVGPHLDRADRPQPGNPGPLRPVGPRHQRGGSSRHRSSRPTA